MCLTLAHNISLAHQGTFKANNSTGKELFVEELGIMGGGGGKWKKESQMVRIVFWEKKKNDMVLTGCDLISISFCCKYNRKHVYR